MGRSAWPLARRGDILCPSKSTPARSTPPKREGSAVDHIGSTYTRGKAKSRSWPSGVRSSSPLSGGDRPPVGFIAAIARSMPGATRHVAREEVLLRVLLRHGLAREHELPEVQRRAWPQGEKIAGQGRSGNDCSALGIRLRPWLAKTLILLRRDFSGEREIAEIGVTPHAYAPAAKQAAAPSDPRGLAHRRQGRHEAILIGVCGHQHARCEGQDQGAAEDWDYGGARDSSPRGTSAKSRGARMAGRYQRTGVSVQPGYSASTYPRSLACVAQ